MPHERSLPEVSFVVRLWLERRAVAGQPAWRFEARHVQSGEQMHCRSLADLLVFVERHAGVPGPRLFIIAGHEAEEVEP